MVKKLSTPKRWILAAAVSVLLTLFLGYFFISSASRGLYAEKVAYLEEISVKSTHAIQKQVDGYFSTLDALCTVIGAGDDFSAQAALAVLLPEADKHSFKRMGVILPDGMAYTTDGFRVDFSDRVYFHEAMAGKQATSDSLIDKLGGEAINVFAAPIFHDDAILGVIFATKSQTELSQSLVIDSFGGEGYSYIISGDGRPVIQTTHPGSIGAYSNFFDSLRAFGTTEEQLSALRGQLRAKATGVLEYTRAGIRRQMFYAPVGINDWYIFSVVPSRIISLQSDRLIRNLGLLMMLMVALALIICSRMIRFFQKNNQRLRHIAYTDATTGHPNWAGFRVTAERLLRENPKQAYAMLAFDINKFKLINDLFGYQRGNEILTFVGDVLQKKCGEDETFCRAAADHFNLLLQYENDGEILRRLKQIEDALDGYIENYKIQISTGICPITEPGLDVSAYSDKANISRSIAKKQNSVRYHFFQDENRLELLREKEIENVMDAALARGEFQVYLQPKYATKDDSICGAEALVRWNRPGDGLVPPGCFIPLFEKNGFIRKLDVFMFESVCRLMAHWMQAEPQAAVLSVSVNISRVHLSNVDLASDLRQIALRHGVPPMFLELELTESAIFQNMEEMCSLMQQLRNAGFQLSIDDFGSGYSSLASLKSLPVDIVKIDKSFLDAGEKDKRGEMIISGMVEMIRNLGMVTVAEGVETRRQLEFLKSAGCDIVQGYYWAKPMPVTEFEALVFGKAEATRPHNEENTHGKQSRAQS